MQEMNIEYYSNQKISINGNICFIKQKELLENLLKNDQTINEKHDIKANSLFYEIKIKYYKNELILKSTTGNKELTYEILKQTLKSL